MSRLKLRPVEDDAVLIAIGLATAYGQGDTADTTDLAGAGVERVDDRDVLSAAVALLWDVAAAYGQRFDPPRPPDEVLQAFAMGQAVDIEE